MSEKKNPLLAILAVVPAIANTVGSLIKDKKKDPTTAIQPAGTEFVHEAIDKGIQLSSKRVMNLLGTGVIVTFAITNMSTNGINKMNLCVLAIGAGYAAVMAFITYLSERK